MLKRNMSHMKMLNNMGSKIEPWGTPLEGINWWLRFSACRSREGKVAVQREQPSRSSIEFKDQAFLCGSQLLSGPKLIETWWLTSGEWSCLLNNDPKFAMAQPNGRWNISWILLLGYCQLCLWSYQNERFCDQKFLWKESIDILDSLNGDSPQGKLVCETTAFGWFFRSIHCGGLFKIWWGARVNT